MIGVLGINYTSSPLDIREKFSFNSQNIVDFGKQITKNPDLKGLIILSTCNRSEIYFQMQDCCPSGSKSFLLKNLKHFFGIDTPIKEYFYYKINNEAYSHLFYVVSGANSMILGEDQIVGQVKDALQISIDNDLSDTELTRLFTKSLEVNKKIRNKTKINQGAFSVSYAGVEKCVSVFPDIEKQNILVVGAGETGTLTLKSLVKKGCCDITVTNRTLGKAVKLANKFEVNCLPIDSLQPQLSYSDIIIISTGSQKALITYEMAKLANNERKSKKQLYIDLSVPRNVDSNIANIENVIVHDVDHLQEVVIANQEKRKQVIKKAEGIVNEYINEFDTWMSTRNLSPIISAIKENFNSVNFCELEGFKKVNKTNGSTQLVEHYGTHITEKYTRLLIKNLKEVTDNGRKTEYIKVLNELFDIS